jgi:hypothetical protein
MDTQLRAHAAHLVGLDAPDILAWKDGPVAARARAGTER